MDLGDIPILSLGGAFFLALGIPMILIVIRNHVRRARAGIVAEFERVFGMQSNASFEFAKSKYQGPDHLQWWKIYLSAVPFMLLSFWGLTLTFMPLRQTEQLDDIAVVFDLLAPTLITNGGQSGESLQYLENALTVVSLAFCGAFLFSLTYLVRAIANFDLAPLTFFRITLNTLMAMATSLILWRSFPNLLPEALTGANTAGTAQKLGIQWYGIAFLIGFFPDLGLNFLVQRIPLPLKRTRDDLLKQCAVASIEIIDGIDVWKRFRLEEIEIVDVENLACANPILLFIETPYGFYETFDWVAQAQLCAIAGPDRFIELRRRHIRTIIDFERAALGPESTIQARKVLAEVLFATSPESQAFFAKWKRPGQTPRVQPAGAGPPQAAEGNAAQPADADAGQGPSAPFAYEDYDNKTFIHFVKAMLDDLHVHRLRQVWIDIVRKLGPTSMSLQELYDMEARVGKYAPPPRTEPPSEPHIVPQPAQAAE